MARLTKYSTGIVGEIKHNIRDFKDGICPTNMEVDPTRTKYNYSLLRQRQSQSITKASTSKLKKHLSLTINLYFICHYFLRDTHRVGFPSRAKRDSLFLSLPRLGSS